MVEAPADARQKNLFPSFCGFNLGSGFSAEFVSATELTRPLKKSEIDRVIGISSFQDRVAQAIEMYYDEVKFLIQNRPVDVVVCVIPDALHEKIAYDDRAIGEEIIEPSLDVGSSEINFRRALKAKAMHLGRPLQLIRASSLESKGKGLQDDATKAWNFCTALYYKAGPTVPWKLSTDPAKPTTCAVGIAFYRSRDRRILDTSLAQIFDELGNGLILRGTPVDVDKEDRVPHLKAQQAYDLLAAALAEYRVAMRSFPARIVVHKSSNFSVEEVEGFDQAGRSLGIDAVDLITVTDSKVKVFRDGAYPPYRGTLVEVRPQQQVLYTRGSVHYYETYPGLYVPQPIELRIVRSDESPSYLAREVLGLTKMNWNNTQFDGKYPVTLGCARKVGEIMKYLDAADRPQVRYGFYM
ncbi:MAG: hypothetical protein IT467_12435 [Dokdonella sp.]|nr:hypothetical protein [Dokdonella sp.]